MSLDNFQSYYQSVFSERWPALFRALQESELKVARWNLFSSDEMFSVRESHKEFHGLSGCFSIDTLDSGPIPRDSNGLLKYYVMDPASVVAARTLGVRSGDRVLDMCAAPGGKSLVLAEALCDSGELIANEISSGRRESLKKVIQQYIPRDVRDRVWITGKDGGQFALREKQSFDRILVDAPCSGERHLLHNKTEMDQWSLSRSKKLAQRQYALLTAALLAAKPGARIVYSTCALSPLENDDVIEKLIKKKGEAFRLISAEATARNQGISEDILSLSESTAHGRQFLPDRSGFGPIYFSVLEVI